MKLPPECENMANIRQEIDQLHQQINELIGRRYTFVKAAAKFEISETSVRVPEQLKTILAQPRAWA